MNTLHSSVRSLFHVHVKDEEYNLSFQGSLMKHRLSLYPQNLNQEANREGKETIITTLNNELTECSCSRGDE